MTKKGRDFSHGFRIMFENPLPFQIWSLYGLHQLQQPQNLLDNNKPLGWEYTVLWDTFQYYLIYYIFHYTSLKFHKLKHIKMRHFKCSLGQETKASLLLVIRIE